MTGTPKPMGGLPPPPPPAAGKGKPPPVPAATATPGPEAPPPPAAAPTVEPTDTAIPAEHADAPRGDPSAAGVELAPAGAALETAEATQSGALDAQQGARLRKRERLRSASDLLFELDSPARPVSRDLEIAFAPDLSAPAQAAPASVQDADEVEAAAPQLPATPVQDAGLDLSQLEQLSPLPSEEKPTTPEGQQQQRVQRLVTRVLTCRDSFRWMGSLGVDEKERKAVARLLMELDPVLDKREGLGSVVKDPEATLRDATPEQLEGVERMLVPIEDRLIAIDDTVATEAFKPQLENRKQSRKIIARYGRLLASRRFSAGQRRDRFEAIATHLLTALNDAGRRRILPPERARVVLDHLIGGLARKQKDHELDEAVRHFEEALARLAQIKTHDEFFESGYFLDLHGYKVSMRDQLVSPEFVYLSVLLNSQIENRIEGWIADITESREANRLSVMGSPREQLLRRVREQEEAVGDSFGVKSRAPAQANRAEVHTPPLANKTSPKSKASTKPRLEISIDRQLVKLAISTLVVIGTGLYLALASGTIELDTVQALEDSEIARLSPTLGRGWIKGSGKSRHFEGRLIRRRWLALDGRRRNEQAEQIARALSNLHVNSAQILLGDRPGIEIRGGYVNFVSGGKL